ncbi:hypothetical protein ES703_81323 [subsurface metagenome]
MRTFRINCSCSIEIAVRLLGSGNFLNEFIEIFFHIRVGLYRQPERRTLKCLVNIRIVKAVTANHVVFKLLASQGFGGSFEIFHSVGLFTFFESMRNCNRTVGFNSRRPENIIKMNISERNCFDGFELLCDFDGFLLAGNSILRIPYAHKNKA